MKPDFKQLLSDEGMPTTEAGWQQVLDDKITDSGSVFSNKSEYSPLMRLFRAVLIAPAMYLVNLLINAWLPQSFVVTASGTWLRLLAAAFGVEAKTQVTARGLITFYRLDTNGALLIPAGTVVQSVAIDGRVYKLRVMADTSFANGEATLLVLCEAFEPGESYNLASGYYSVLPVAISGVTGVNNEAGWLTRPGADDERDEDIKARVINQFSAVNQWHTDAVYRSIIASFAGVAAQNVFFLKNAPRGPGSANAYVMLETGNPSQTFIDAINDRITTQGNHGHGDDMQVFAMPETFKQITVDLWPDAALTPTEVSILQDNVEQFIRCAFRENNNFPATKVMPFERFSYSNLVAELHEQFTGIQEVDFTSPAITLNIEIARIDTLTITVKP